LLDSDFELRFEPDLRKLSKKKKLKEKRAKRKKRESGIKMEYTSLVKLERGRCDMGLEMGLKVGMGVRRISIRFVKKKTQNRMYINYYIPGCSPGAFAIPPNLN
jgi:hypothetical protein